jgi:hypothetical protein
MLRFIAALAMFVMPFFITSAGTASDNSYVAMTPSTAAAIQTFEAGRTPVGWSPIDTGPLTQIANIGPAALTIEHQYPQQVALVQAHAVDFGAASNLTQAQLLQPGHAKLLANLLKDVQGLPYTRAHGAVATLLWIDQIKPQLQFLSKYEPQLLALQSASAAAPAQWQHWLWIAFVCVILFVPFVFLMKGRWSPMQARRDEREHEAIVARELARMRQAGS